ncbi:MAG: hypothetical protein IIB80_02975 [Thaumarchaeota archaeon]|nr:hypothetical protein [Nitrososphaerota archaeon]
MISQHMLSNAQYKYLTSQDSKITNISEQRDRITEKADKMFNTFRIIINSKNIDQEFKDKIFPTHKVTAFISNLTEYDAESTASQEEIKQEILIDLMKQSLKYFQTRYTEVFIKKEVKNFEQFAIDIVEFTRDQIEETEAQKLYHTRKPLVPPLLYPKRDTWTALCLQCLKYSVLGDDKDDAITKIHHSKNCSYLKEKKKIGMADSERIKIQFFKITPPEKKA